MTTQRQDRGADGQPVAPVDDRTYNILQALTSTLEAMDAYEVYASDDDEDGLFSRLLTTQRQNAEELLAALRSSLAAAER